MSFAAGSVIGSFAFPSKSVRLSVPRRIAVGAPSTVTATDTSAPATGRSPAFTCTQAVTVWFGPAAGPNVIVFWNRPVAPVSTRIVRVTGAAIAAGRPPRPGTSANVSRYSPSARFSGRLISPTPTPRIGWPSGPSTGCPSRTRAVVP